MGPPEKEGFGMIRIMAAVRRSDSPKGFSRRGTLAVLLVLFGFGASFPGPAAGQDTHLLVVVGLGGDPEYRETFHGWAVDLTTTAVERLGMAPERIGYLGERPEDHPELIQDRSTRENLASRLAGMARDAGPRDRILVVLIGHGTGSRDAAQFNLPGPDLTPEALDVMLRDFPTQTVGVVNTTPSSGPFVQGLSGPNRVIMTATRTAQEGNETQFGAFFVGALKGEGSDLDKDGRISLLEAFEFTRLEVQRYYDEQNLLSTEHAQLDDNGDGVGVSEVGDESSDGWLARSFWLGSFSALSAAAPDSITDPEILRLYEERADLERRIQQLRALRGQMEESRYEQELEDLLVGLALKNREIRAKGGGGT
jgi:hypothetical protein